jgi:hypothetical protein
MIAPCMRVDIWKRLDHWGLSTTERIQIAPLVNVDYQVVLDSHKVIPQFATIVSQIRVSNRACSGLQ